MVLSSSRARELGTLRGVQLSFTMRLTNACSLNAYEIQTILGAVSVFGTIPSLYLIEKWGRRKVRLKALSKRKGF